MNTNEERLVRYLAARLSADVRIYGEDGTEEERIRESRIPDDGMLLLPAILDTLLRAQEIIPVIAAINEHWFYFSLKLGEKRFIIGPLAAPARYGFYYSYHLMLADEDREMLNSHETPVSFSEAVRTLSHVVSLLSSESGDAQGVTLLPEDIMAANLGNIRNASGILSEVTQTVFDNMESGARHNPYDEEVREMAAVEAGDTELLSQILEEPYRGELGVVADNALRQEKNIAIVLITISSRAAIRGGVPYEVAFSMSDHFIREVEKQTTPEAAAALSRNAEFQYAQTVREYRRSIRSETTGRENEHVEHCKSYIFNHLHDKIRVSEIADRLALNSNYLSTVFKRCEGITITDYILRQKLILVRNLLIYSRYSYLEITNYLGFSSQSWLGKKFREETGMTLREYRTRYRVREFVDNEEAAG